MSIKQDSWVNPNMTLTNQENSGIKSNFDFAPMSTRYKSNNTTNYAQTKPKPIKKGNDLNDWNFCNPEIYNDKLPQPYRMINSILESEILQPVYKKIFQIEDMKNNPSYEGGIKKTGPSGVFEMGRITSICKDSNTTNQLLVGDADGKVSLIDLARKNLTGRMDTNQKVEGKDVPLPVITINSIELNYGDYSATVFSAIQKGSNVIKIYMFSTVNFQMFHAFTIMLPNQDQLVNVAELVEDSNISKTAMNCVFSKNAQHIVVTLLNGDAHVYALPPLPIQNDNFSNIDYSAIKESTQNSQNFLSPDYYGGDTVKPPPPKNEFVETIFCKNMSDHIVKDITDFMMHIPVKLPQKEYDMDELKKKLAQTTKTEVEEEVEGLNHNTSAKKIPARGKAPPLKGVKSQEVVVEVEEINEEYQNNEPILFGERAQELTKLPTYYPLIHLMDESYVTNPSLYFDYEKYDAYYKKTDNGQQGDEQANERIHKAFNKSKKINMTTKILVCWKNNIIFESFDLQKLNLMNLPVQYNKNYIFFSNYVHKKIYKQYEEEVKAKSLMPSSDFKKFERILFYPITCTSVSSRNIFLAIGCNDGTIILWDLELSTIKSTLDRHLKEVSCLCFFEQWMQCSGGLDGSVHLYDISNVKSDMDPSLFMDKKNFFTINSKEKSMEDSNEVKSICASENGLLLVVDKHNFARIYSVYHGNKVYKLLSSVTFTLDNQDENVLVTSFKCDPRYLIHGHKEQFVIISEKSKKNEVFGNGILIYKVFDCLMNAYPTLKNFYKAGYSKEVCIGLFTKMTHEDLSNDNFVVPGRTKVEETKVKKGRAGSKRRGSRASRVGSEQSIGRSIRSSCRSINSLGGSVISENQDTYKEQVTTNYSNPNDKMNMSTTTEDGMDYSRISNDGRQTMVSYKIQAPVEKLGFNLYPKQDKTSKLTKQNLDPEKIWQKKFTNNIKPIYQGELDATKNVFQRMGEREMREKRFYSFMTKTGKDMEEISKIDRAALVKKMIK